MDSTAAAPSLWNRLGEARGRKENELGFGFRWPTSFDPVMETDNRPMGMNGPDVLAATGLNMAQAGAPNTDPGPG